MEGGLKPYKVPVQPLTPILWFNIAILIDIQWQVIIFSSLVFGWSFTMLISAGTFTLAALLVSLLCCTLVSASPFVSPDRIFGLERRQEDITIGNVATEDETDDEIAADGTGAMRSEQIANFKQPS